MPLLGPYCKLTFFSINSEMPDLRSSMFQQMSVWPYWRLGKLKIHKSASRNGKEGEVSFIGHPRKEAGRLLGPLPFRESTL